ncbi:MAG: choice-of-anchor B family protein, partial [Candidatus Eisenbacteria bacterium]|nr:choice-of-anchor B family protein [Candidatus Eisenbacteria bacterium]
MKSLRSSRRGIRRAPLPSLLFGFRFPILAGMLAAAAGPAPGVPLHEDPLAEDAQDPYVGPGHAGSIAYPDAQGKVLDTFSASNVALLSWVPIGEFPGGSGRAAEVFGYVSPSGREYALIGLERGFGFVDVTDPTAPVVLGVIPGRPSIWREMDAGDGFAYCVHDLPSDDHETGDGLSIVDLRQIDAGTVSLARAVTDLGLKTSHNVWYSAESRTAWLCGSNLAGPYISGGGLLAVDLSDPLNPSYTAGTVWTETYVHDVIVRRYASGPQAGRELAYAACGEAGLKIIDVTDRENMVTLSTLVYPHTGYCHDGWLAPDGRTLYLNDETDELYDPEVPTTTTHVVDVQNPAAPVYLRSFTNGLPAIDHNHMGRGGFLYEANYRSGLRIYDVRQPGGEAEAGWFDTYPADDEPHFNGAWGVYAGLPSGTILVSDIERGLFVLRHLASDAPAPAGALRLELRGAPNPFRGAAALR